MNCKKCGKKVYSKEVCSCGEKAPNVNGGAVTVNSIICGVLLFMTVFSLILSFSLRQIVNNDLLVKAVNDTDLAKIETRYEGETVYLPEYINKKFIDDERITSENVANVLRSSSVKKFMTDKIDAFEDFFMDDAEMPIITANDIVGLIDKNKTLLYGEAGLQFLEPDKQKLREDLSSLDDFSKFCSSYLTNWFTEGYIQTFFSLYYVIFLALMIVIILVQWCLVYKFNNRRISNALKRYGIITVIPSFLTLIISLAAYIFNLSMIPNRILVPFILSSLVLFVLGAALLTASLIAGRSRSRTEAAPALISADTVPDIHPEDAVSSDSTSADEKKPETDTPKPDDTQWAAPVNKADDSRAVIEEKDSEPEKEAIAVKPAKTEDKTESKIDSKTDNKADDKADKAGSTEPAENKPDVKTDAKPAPNKEFVFCTKCGNKNRRNSKFCSKCGSSLRK